MNKIKSSMSEHFNLNVASLQKIKNVALATAEALVLSTIMDNAKMSTIQSKN